MVRESAQPFELAKAGPLPRLSPERMVEELAQHGRSPVTWLIGAGFSQSAGLPLASEVWQLLAIWWQKRRRGRSGLLAGPGTGDAGETRPAPGLAQLLTGARDLLPFTFSPGGALTPPRRPAPAPGVPEEIDTETAQLRDDLLRALSDLRDRAGPAQRAALSSGRDDLHTYQAVFDLAAPTPEARRSFLSALIAARCGGPNLGHLILAMFLGEERGPRMHTVFTVNFDDLLLESLLSLRKQARVFAEQGGSNGWSGAGWPGGDRPQLSPSWPQIVHLHGRGGGYLGGFGGAKGLGPDGSGELLESFQEHLRESSLIVCGYGGGDERILGVLRRWLSGGDLSGPLYWVAHDEAHAEAVTARLVSLGLGAAARERVRLVTSPLGGTLTADELMVEVGAALLPSLSSSAAGAQGSGLLDAVADLARRNGRRLQGALGQLARDFPDRDPVAAHLRAVHSVDPYGAKYPARAVGVDRRDAASTEERRRHLAAAAELARSADVPAWQAQVRMAEMREHFSRGEIELAQVAAEHARRAAEEAPQGILRCQTLGLCGELALWLGRMDLGRERLGKLLREESCPEEWRAEARAQMLHAVLRSCHASGPWEAGPLEEARRLLELRVDSPAAAVHTLIYEAELYFLQGDLRRAVLVYETADEVAGRHARAMSVKGLGSPGMGGAAGPGEGLLFSAPVPGEAESEISLLRASRQARFGLLLCRVAASRDAGGLPDGYLEDVDHFIGQHVGPPGGLDGEGQWMAASLLFEAATGEVGRLRRAEEYDESARRLCGQQSPPWRAAQVLRTAASIALLGARLDEAERHTRAALRHARAIEQYDEEGRLDLLLSQLYRERGRRAVEDDRQRALRRAVAHAEAAWLRGLELGSTFLTEDADDLLGTLRSTPTEIAGDVTPVPRDA